MSISFFICSFIKIYIFSWQGNNNLSLKPELKKFEHYFKQAHKGPKSSRYIDWPFLACKHAGLFSVTGLEHFASTVSFCFKISVYVSNSQSSNFRVCCIFPLGSIQWLNDGTSLIVTTSQSSQHS